MKITFGIKILILCIAMLLAAGIFLSAETMTAGGKKINGVSLVAPVRQVGIEALKPIATINASWIAVTPFAFSREGQPEVTFNHPHQWWGERKEGVAQTIKDAQKLGFKVMLKPHVWVRGQGWAGDFELSTEQQWKKWEAGYTNYILSYAKIADSLHIKLVCIGTEYKKAVNQRPAFWRQLIKEVRKVYHGKLTYAANWDNYQNVTFWDALDYIGIDAYFPLSEQKTPSVDELVQHWQPVKQKLHAFSVDKNRPILFTEFGYQSVDFAADAHWKYERDERSVNNLAQMNAYEAVFKSFWNEDWFAGGFIWKWYSSPPRYNYDRSKGYTPQGKPAEKTLQKWYGTNITSKDK